MSICQSPLDVAQGFAQAWNANDAEALAGLFMEDADFVNVVGLWWHDREHIRQAHAYGFWKIFRNSEMKLGRTSVRELGPDVAVVHAAWSMTGQESHDNREAGKRRGVISFTVQRQDNGGWLAVAAQNTDRINGAETHIAASSGLEAAHYGNEPDA
ncbi:SgcJ/EcaC family oxidoreductase [Corynebacterium casei]|uniref:SgcJ/EcaC family oxidoreductase n=1 Tax=Corynebacterium casei TaxID=160386 RepID=UPI003F909066